MTRHAFIDKFFDKSLGAPGTAERFIKARTAETLLELLNALMVCVPPPKEQKEADLQICLASSLMWASHMTVTAEHPPDDAGGALRVDLAVLRDGDTIMIIELKTVAGVTSKCSQKLKRTLPSRTDEAELCDLACTYGGKQTTVGAVHASAKRQVGGYKAVYSRPDVKAFAVTQVVNRFLVSEVV